MINGYQGDRCIHVLIQDLIVDCPTNEVLPCDCQDTYRSIAEVPMLDIRYWVRFDLERVDIDRSDVVPCDYENIRGFS